MARWKFSHSTGVYEVISTGDEFELLHTTNGIINNVIGKGSESEIKKQMMTIEKETYENFQLI